MRKMGRWTQHFLGALVMLAVMLIALWFILNVIATKTPAPVSTAAQTVEGLASGSQYGL